MVERQLRPRGIRDPRVLQAMLDIPREEFVPLENRSSSYADEPVSIGFVQTISQPYMTALMAELLELKGTETVLEVGAGCGYAAAVLGALAARRRIYGLPSPRRGTKRHRAATWDSARPPRLTTRRSS